MRWSGGITELVDMSLSELWETVKNREARGCKETGLRDQTTTMSLLTGLWTMFIMFSYIFSTEDKIRLIHVYFYVFMYTSLRV